MSEDLKRILGSLILIAIYVIPLSLLWWGIRRFRRRRVAREKARAEAERRAAEEAAARAAAGETPEPAPYRFHIEGGTILGAFLIYFVLLLGALSGARKWWGYIFQAAYLGFLGLTFWTAFSRKEFERERARDPELTRGNWISMWLVLFALIPLAAWLILGLPAFF